jgi:hypothetical protein
MALASTVITIFAKKLRRPWDLTGAPQLTERAIIALDVAIRTAA